MLGDIRVTSLKPIAATHRLRVDGRQSLLLADGIVDIDGNPALVKSGGMVTQVNRASLSNFNVLCLACRRFG